jgi:hypothetical protein
MLTGGRLSIGRAEMDGGVGRASGGVGLLANMDRTGGEFHKVS